LCSFLPKIFHSACYLRGGVLWMDLQS
jgi:hypothetical protein